MAKQSVFMNRRGFGAQVMTSPELEEELRTYARQVAGQIPGSSLEVIRTGVGSTNARVRVRVVGEAQQRARLVAAIRAVVGSAKKL